MADEDLGSHEQDVEMDNNFQLTEEKPGGYYTGEITGKRALFFPIDQESVSDFINCVNSQKIIPNDLPFLKQLTITNNMQYLVTEYFDGEMIWNPSGENANVLLQICLNKLQNALMARIRVRSTIFLVDSSHTVKIARCITNPVLVDPMVLSGISQESSEKSDVYHLGCIFLGGPNPNVYKSLKDFGFDHKIPEMVQRMCSIFPVCRPTVTEALSGILPPQTDKEIARDIIDLLIQMHGNYIPQFPMPEDYTLTDLAKLNYDQITQEAKEQSIRTGLTWLKMYFGLSENITDEKENTLQKLMQQYPNVGWIISMVIINPNITVDFVQANPQFRWDLRFLSLNPGVNVQDILFHPEIPWNYWKLSSNRNMTPDFVQDHIHEKWDWTELARFLPTDMVYAELKRMEDPEYSLRKDVNLPFARKLYDNFSENKHVAFYNVIADKQKPWNWQKLTRNPNVATWRNISSQPNLPWDWEYISAKIVDTKIVQEDLKTYPWNMLGLSMNPSVTVQFVQANPEFDWDWNELAKNSGMDIDFLMERFNGDTYHISDNPKLTLQIILSSPLADWDWNKLSQNSSVANWVNVHAEPNLNWDWRWLSANPNIATRAHVRDNPQLPWNWNWMSRNIGLKWQTVAENINQNWDWMMLSQNLYGFGFTNEDRIMALLTQMEL